MLKALREWQRHRAEAKKEKRFDKGFASVMLLYFHHELTLEALADQGHLHIAGEKWDPFASGWVEAVDRLNMMEEKLGGPLY